MTTHRIIFGDSRDMGRIPDKSVQLIVTSPPYWQLKDYGAEEQIGFHESYEAYINDLNLVWQECDRVLADGCRLCVNIGDQFARSVYYGRYKVIPIRTEIIRFCETIGMDYMGAVIWQKATTMHTSGGGAVMGSFPYPRNGILKMDYEFILLFKKQGKPPKPTAEQKALSAMTKEEWNRCFSSHWNFSGVKQQGHLAMFPEELPGRLIRMFSFSGETVLDPFAGSGTTSLAAKHLGRHSIGYELNQTFRPLIRSKILETPPEDGNGPPLDRPAEPETERRVLPDTESAMEAGDCRLTFETDPSRNFSPDSLPYRFTDPHRMDKKRDVKERSYGSKIDGKEEKTEELYSVRQILSPEMLELGNGQIVRLLGVRERPEHSREAVAYLQQKVRKRRVYLRYDNMKYDADRHPLCYLYLDNRTFVNNHLIRTGFVGVDTETEYRWKDKFLRSLPDVGEQA